MKCFNRRCKYHSDVPSGCMYDFGIGCLDFRGESEQTGIDMACGECPHCAETWRISNPPKPEQLNNPLVVPRIVCPHCNAEVEPITLYPQNDEE